MILESPLLVALYATLAVICYYVLYLISGVALLLGLLSGERWLTISGVVLLLLSIFLTFYFGALALS